MKLKINVCTYTAAKYACKTWHYSKTIPAGKMVRLGVWEDNKFIGVVIFSYGANHNINKPFGLKKNQVCELTRIALTKHKTKVSRIISICLKILKKTNPYMRIVVSYADMDQNHMGIVYQASNWIYLGIIDVGRKQHKMEVFGIMYHLRSIASKGWKQSLNWVKEHIDKNAKMIETKGKHKYIYPLDKELYEKYRHISKPYPKATVV